MKATTYLKTPTQPRLRAVWIKIDDINPSKPGRFEPNADAIADYLARYKRGDRWPPILVVRINGELWLADGGHRIASARQMGLTRIKAYVLTGTEIDRVLIMCTVNLNNGVCTTKDDRDVLVIRYLECDPELSDKEIGRIVGVSGPTVASRRSMVLGADTVFRRGRDGKRYRHHPEVQLSDMLPACPREFMCHEAVAAEPPISTPIAHAQECADDADLVLIPNVDSTTLEFEHPAPGANCYVNIEIREVMTEFDAAVQDAVAALLARNAKGRAVMEDMLAQSTSDREVLNEIRLLTQKAKRVAKMASSLAFTGETAA